MSPPDVARHRPILVAMTVTTFRTLDGLHLAGTLVTPGESTESAVVLVHGGGVTREEGGFFTRLAAGLAEAGLASLRFDLRGHGESEGRQEELTLATILNDIRVALHHVREATGATRTSLLGTSFGGGICGYYAAHRPEEVLRLVLLNPQLDYKRRTIDSRPYWHDDLLDEETARLLNEQGYIAFTPSLRHGRPLLNEVFWLQPHTVLGQIKAPTLIVHGTEDTLVPIDTSRAAVPQFTAACTLMEVEGSQHGFAVHDDPQYLDSQSQIWQAEVIRTVADGCGTSFSRYGVRPGSRAAPAHEGGSPSGPGSGACRQGRWRSAGRVARATRAAWRPTTAASSLPDQGQRCRASRLEIAGIAQGEGVTGQDFAEDLSRPSRFAGLGVAGGAPQQQRVAGEGAAERPHVLAGRSPEQLLGRIELALDR